MKKLLIMLIVLVMAFSSIFAGCVVNDGSNTGDNGSNSGNTGNDGGNTDGGNTDDGDDTPTPVYYTIVFNITGATGTTPTETDKQAGETFVMPQANFTNGDYIFAGWDYRSTIYQPGDVFIMPENDVIFYARWTTQPKDSYAVNFNLNGGNGNIPSIGNVEEGSFFTIPNVEPSKSYCSFLGWQYGSAIYHGGDMFIMPSNAVTFTAIWRDENTYFTMSTYVYDRVGAGVMEIPFETFSGELGVVEVNGAFLDETIWSYDATKKVIIIKEDYMLNLANGEYVINAYTSKNISTCVLKTTNSISTRFDAITTKSLDVYNNTTGVVFQVAYAKATVSQLKMGDQVVPSTYYTVGTSTFTLKTSWVKKFVRSSSYTLYLSNGDRYNFTVNSNVIFSTDYDYNTIHDTKASNVGQNSLYQYYDNVSIVNAPNASGEMSGKVLKFTPNVADVTYDCHGIFTLASIAGESALVCWYKAGFVTNKDYYVSFDYYTEGLNVISGSKLEFRQEGSAWCDNLLYGGSNNGVVHHYTRLIKGSEIGRGFILWGVFKGASTRGSIYIDNFTVIEVAQG